MTRYPRISELSYDCEKIVFYKAFQMSGKHEPKIEQAIYDVEMTRLNELLYSTDVLIKYINTFDFQGLFIEDNVMRYPSGLDDRLDRYLKMLVVSSCSVCDAAESVLREPTKYKCCVAWKECAFVVWAIKVQEHNVIILRKCLYDYNEMMNAVPSIVNRSVDFIEHIRTVIDRVEERHWHYVYKRANKVKKWWIKRTRSR